ncbi:hypothetical protein DI005_28390 [Prauserella sp. PE36]|nr:hypothetical protein DI005_28390 [Prauserella sp. PE36]
MPWLNVFAPRRIKVECETCATPMPHSPFATFGDLILVATAFRWVVYIRDGIYVWCPEHQEPSSPDDNSTRP